MRNRDIKIEMPKGIRLVNSFHKPFTPAVDGLPINLGTSWGNASFVNYMHHIFKVMEDIINDEYNRDELKDFLRVNDNELDEKIKVLNINNGTSTVLPNMYINTKNVIANHSASISTIDSKYLFYLNSKGINNDLATKLIIDGFLNNN